MDWSREFRKGFPRELILNGNGRVSRVSCVSVERKTIPERWALPEGKGMEGNKHSESKEPKGGQHGWQVWHGSGEVLTMLGEVDRDQHTRKFRKKKSRITELNE